MKISIIHPSYGRPELAFQTWSKWISKANNKTDIQYLMCVSKSDPSLKTYTDYFTGIDFGNHTFLPIYSEQSNMVVQMNEAAKESTGDLIIAISDDFDCPDSWDHRLLNQIAGRKDFVVRIDDGIRNPGILTEKIIPMPIMDRTFYNRFGYIYQPDYNHFFGDEELFRVGVILGAKIEVPLLFPHIHPVTGKVQSDHVNKKNNAFHPGDKETFKKREAEGFGLKGLSILIPTLKKRSNFLKNLLITLDEQTSSLKAEGLVEILLSTDEGEKTIGRKRNILVKAATKDYVAFIDDDDRVSANYIQLLLKAIQLNPDCCSLEGILSTPGRNSRVFKHSIEFQGWYEKAGVLYRYPNHLNCIRASIAKQIRFPEISRGEDRAFSNALQNSGLLKTEAKIEGILYYYDFVNDKS